MTRTDKRLIVALCAYAAILGCCSLLLTGKILLAVAIIFLGLIAKTLIAWKAGW